MYLVDTNVISESRKGSKANAGVKAFFQKVVFDNSEIYLSVITIGELRHGVERIRYRGDTAQADALEHWLEQVTKEYSDNIIAFDAETAHVWGRLRVPNPENGIDKQIAATALLHDLMVVTRNVKDYSSTGVRLWNPFE
ncbi:MAG: type II toxin-antitoxin system VapC family toxin [Pseudomonadota bacterium]